MFVSSRIIYLQMQKTGSTHAAEVLQKYVPGRVQRKHEKLKDHHGCSSRIIASSVRNPWEWYVSLWAYGCSGAGGLRNYLNRLPGSELRGALRSSDLGSALLFVPRTLAGRPNWKRLYSDPTSESNFREWLKLILGSEGMRLCLEGYASSQIKKYVGLMTYRFLALTTAYWEWTRMGRECRSYDEVVAFAQEHTVVTEVLRFESLDQDLFRLLKAAGVDVSKDDVTRWGKQNTSSHRNYAEYYDDEASSLVRARDRFIIDRFGYQTVWQATKKSALLGVWVANWLIANVVLDQSAGV
jgi:hypothetical protein